MTYDMTTPPHAVVNIFRAVPEHGVKQHSVFAVTGCWGSEKNPWVLGFGIPLPRTPCFIKKFRHWVVGVQDKILQCVLGVRQGVLFQSLYVIFWNSP